ncbi:MULTISPECIES: hypothetical protein [Planktothricoides]|uniref:Uncharacterized protein n=1 Tax=Planktothricoides raciborskii FACHB-1370 TaxID=2949576 RepID=A0ABR8EKP8_9CYAN|nr:MULTISPECIES: hypothetical protein [Planktothricoides]KOR33758.1 hypothetical protein AM228_27935 [Planktothricoides sp. SR001]MBD2547221.1 hypothetical protein [Planktothricoides raciborskii FACHB-1370]MBD2585775.1 hypothetical protein [Planktothricoides raciborskii FACHB-1261]
MHEKNPVSYPHSQPEFSETGFLLCYQQLSLLSTIETRFLIPTVNPNTQKPGFFFATNSYLYYPP